ncbi:EI24 domain-containing protein [Qipengyuania sediminis]|uniref:EI24 domain-containing protein n=1 Tax=Qipengyuania sediminis TaxID=1532023 RepID=UPI00105A534E|nr:EI24 domain-containing protein [Qipengyuania sediminis]
MLDLPRAFALSFVQLADPAVLRVLAKSLLATLGIFAAAGLILWQGIAAVISRYAADYAEVGALAAVLLGVLGAWLLFRVVAIAVLQFFADDVVRAVERRHYPSAAAVPKAPLSREFAASFRGLTRVLAVNAVVLPLALVLLVTGVGAALLLWVANGWLLGRELTEMVSLRHRPAGTGAGVGGATRFALGGITAVLMAVPFVNLIAPVLSAGATTHLVHGGRTARA